MQDEGSGPRTTPFTHDRVSVSPYPVRTAPPSLVVLVVGRAMAESCDEHRGAVGAYRHRVGLIVGAGGAVVALGPHDRAGPRLVRDRRVVVRAGPSEALPGDENRRAVGADRCGVCV